MQAMQWDGEWLRAGSEALNDVPSIIGPRIDPPKD